jgi:hypothetical protein
VDGLRVGALAAVHLPIGVIHGVLHVVGDDLRARQLGASVMPWLGRTLLDWCPFDAG